MKVLKISVVILFLFSSRIFAIPPLDEIYGLINAKRNKDFSSVIGGEVFSAIGSKAYVQEVARKRCGCSLKGSNPDYPDGIEISSYGKFADTPDKGALWGNSHLMKESPNFHNTVLIGDSLTKLGTTQDNKFTWNKDYAPGWGIVNGGIAMATSQDISEWLDTCASQNSRLWQSDPAQVSCEENPKGRFACDPPPNSGRYSGYVQFQNRHVIVMIGGNDFNVGLYKTLLETYPALVPFRHNNVANQIDKILTYVERQSGTRKTLLGYMPIPSYYPGTGEPLLNTLNRIGLFSKYDQWFEKSEDGVLSIVKGRYIDIPGGRTLAATYTLLKSYVQKALTRDKELNLTNILSCLSTIQPDLSGYCEKLRGDNTWLSQRLIELNVVMASVAQSRAAGMYTLYNTFVDYGALARGYWYVGNKHFWNMDYNAEGYDKLMYEVIQNRGANDSIHPNHLGYQAWGSTLDSILKKEKSNIKQTPFAYRDGCFIEPNDPGPYEECMTKNFHEWENGTCVDRTPQPPAPVVVVNPTPPPTSRPPAPPPPTPTRENPRPATDDNTLLLIGACFFFGVCRL